MFESNFLNVLVLLGHLIRLILMGTLFQIIYCISERRKVGSCTYIGVKYAFAYIANRDLT